jgi:D-alanine transaminase
MSRIAYVNGRYVPHREATVSIDDRGYQFADGVYEVIAVTNGRLVDEGGHLDRLDRSLSELSIAWPMSRRAMQLVMREVIRRNGVTNGIIYLQLTRGVARRDHPFPVGVAPSLVMTARRAKPIPASNLTKGVGVVTFADQRWARCDIKSTSLLPNILGKQAARQAGAYEGWMVDNNGFVTEGTSTNAWIVTDKGELITRNVSHAILNGITRLAVIQLAGDNGLKLVERPFTVAEAKAAREAFTSSTTNPIQPVVAIDGAPVGDGKPGRIALELRRAYEAATAQGGVNG